MSPLTLIIIQLIILIILIISSAFFSGAETALFSLSRARLLAYKESSSDIHQIIERLMSSYNTTLIAIITGNMFVNIGISLLTNTLLGRLPYSPLVMTIISIFMTVIVLLLFGEVTPKAIALANSEWISAKVAKPIYFLKVILTPFIIVINWQVSRILNFLGRRQMKALQHEEYATFLELASTSGGFSNSEVDFIRQIFMLRKRKISTVMTPRINIDSLTKQMSASEVYRKIYDEKELFFPVIEKDIDDTEYLFSVKDFFRIPIEKRDQWKEFTLHPALFIPEGASLTQALTIIKQSAISCALVVDEYGGVVGIVEDEDIYAELIGEIEDEHSTPEWEIRQDSEHEWTLNAMISISLVEKTLPGFELKEKPFNANNLNGIFCETFERIPLAKDSLILGGYRFVVKSANDQRALLLLATQLSPEEK